MYYLNLTSVALDNVRLCNFLDYDLGFNFRLGLGHTECSGWIPAYETKVMQALIFKPFRCNAHLILEPTKHHIEHLKFLGLARLLLGKLLLERVEPTLEHLLLAL